MRPFEAAFGVGGSSFIMEREGEGEGDSKRKEFVDFPLL